MKKMLAGITAAVASAIGPVLAQGAATGPETGPSDGAIDMIPAASALAEQVHFFHNWVLLPIISVISLLILVLLLIVIFRFNSKANPTPRKFSHNTLIEVIWTAVPIVILLFIALFSFDLLYSEDVVPDGKQIVVQADGSTSEFFFANDFPATRMASRPDHVQVFLAGAGGVAGLKRGDDYKLDGLGEGSITVTLNEAPAAGSRVMARIGRSVVDAADCSVANRFLGSCDKTIALAPTMTLKVIGYQWGWTYAYPDFGDFEFSSNMLPEDQTTPDLYRWEVDNRVIVPVGETIRVVTTARDVIHSFALPSFTLKIDAVPGRINEAWFQADKEGVYYGQCSEICGVKHSFMPIAVEVVSRDKFEAWVDSQRALAGLDPMFDADAAKFAQVDTENVTAE